MYLSPHRILQIAQMAIKHTTFFFIIKGAWKRLVRVNYAVRSKQLKSFLPMYQYTECLWKLFLPVYLYTTHFTWYIFLLISHNFLKIGIFLLCPYPEYIFFELLQCMLSCFSYLNFLTFTFTLILLTNGTCNNTEFIQENATQKIVWNSKYKRITQSRPEDQTCF